MERTETRKILSEKRIDDNTVLQYAEKLEGDPDTIVEVREPVTAANRQEIAEWVEGAMAVGECFHNREKAVHNYPRKGDNDVNRFINQDIQNDTCSDVPVLEPPTYQNKSKDGEPEIEIQNVDGDDVPVLVPPSYDHGRKVARREQARTVQNDDDDSDVPVLEPPTYENKKDGR